MKSFFKFILVLIGFVVLWNWFFSPDINVIYTSEHQSGGFWIEALIAPIVVMIVLGVLFIVFSVIGAVFISLLVAFAGLFFVGVSLMWPILIGAILLYWLFSDPKQNEVNQY